MSKNKAPSTAGKAVISSTVLHQSSQEVSDYRKGIRSTRDSNNKRHPDDAVDVVMKFGGSSLADASRVDHVAKLIQSQIEAGFRARAVVCSAMGKTTNALLSAGDFALDGRVCVDAIRTLHVNTMDEFDLPNNTRAEVMELLDECESMLNGVKLIQELSLKSLDQLVSYGERCSVRIMAARLNQLGVPAQSFDAWEVGIVTDSEFGDAKLLPTSGGLIRRAFDGFDPNVVAVVTGFIGHSPEGKITTLGRGGSDLTATQIGAALDLDEIQCWKDVDGILSTDPRLVEAAVPIKSVSYSEAAELSYFGASVLHPIAMYPAMQSNTPVRIKNSYNPSAEGSLIANTKSENPLVTAITFKRDVKVLDIGSTKMLGAYGFLARVFGDFEKHKLSVDMLASSEVSVSLTLDKKQKMESIRDLIADMSPYADVTLCEQRSILTLIADVQRSSEVLSTVFRVFTERNIQVKMMSQGASKVNISFIVRDDQLNEAVTELHKCFFEDKCIVEQSTPNSHITEAQEVAL